MNRVFSGTGPFLWDLLMPETYQAPSHFRKKHSFCPGLSPVLAPDLLVCGFLAAFCLCPSEFHCSAELCYIHSVYLENGSTSSVSQAVLIEHSEITDNAFVAGSQMVTPGFVSSIYSSPSVPTRSSNENHFP